MTSKYGNSVPSIRPRSGNGSAEPFSQRTTATKARAAQELPEGRLPLTQLADELLVGVELLEDIVSLLEDKGQVILYGPPGTGKDLPSA